LELLVERNWIDDFVVTKWHTEKSFVRFGYNISLTPQGMIRQTEILKLVLENIFLLRSSSPSEDYFKKIAAGRDGTYNLNVTTDPSRHTIGAHVLANNMVLDVPDEFLPYEDPADTNKEFNAEKILQAASLLTPQKMNVFLRGCKLTDDFYTIEGGIRMKVEPIDEKIFQYWADLMSKKIVPSGSLRLPYAFESSKK
jgi:secreted Zn-dependent insulinase-like peptidase